MYRCTTYNSTSSSCLRCVPFFHCIICDILLIKKIPFPCGNWATVSSLLPFSGCSAVVLFFPLPHPYPSLP